ncbi:MAG: carbohydrate-binding family 9-like protein [Bacteroidales bacterium]|nr:carbohydrate-binding family 9-like protein [Bacteroidales bacterium]
MLLKIRKFAALRSVNVLALFVLLSGLPYGCDNHKDAEETDNNVSGHTYRPPAHYICYRAGNQITVDGIIEEKEWHLSPWSTDFQDIEGDIKPLPKYRTRMKMLWDDHALYVAAELEEPQIWARLKQRDTVIFFDNDFEVFIDPDGDAHLYYEIEMNALNTVWDLLLIKPYRDGGPPVTAWDVDGMKTAVHLDGTLNNPSDRDQGWTVEMSIPFSVLTECAPSVVPPVDGTHWRINFSRVEWKTRIEAGRYLKLTNPDNGKPLPEDNWVWSPQGKINMHMPEKWGILQFSTDNGSRQVRYRPDPDGYQVWMLWQVYYAEKKFKSENGKYCQTISRLNLPGIIKPDEIRAISLDGGDAFFHARIDSYDKGMVLSITDDGCFKKNEKAQK